MSIRSSEDDVQATDIAYFLPSGSFEREVQIRLESAGHVSRFQRMVYVPHVLGVERASIACPRERIEPGEESSGQDGRIAFRADTSLRLGISGRVSETAEKETDQTRCIINGVRKEFHYFGAFSLETNVH